VEANLAKARDEVEAARNDLAVLRTAAEESGAEVARLKGELARPWTGRPGRAGQGSGGAGGDRGPGPAGDGGLVLKGELGK
jgi:hypothetical protein